MAGGLTEVPCPPIIFHFRVVPVGPKGRNSTAQGRAEGADTPWV